MRIRWERLLGIILFGTAIYLFIKLRPFIGHLLEVANSDQDYGDPIKAIMLGVLCLTFICGIKLLVIRKQETKHHD